MSGDLAHRLRVANISLAPLILEAAERIEELEAEVAEWERDYPNLVAAACACAVARAEDERLHVAAPSEPGGEQ